MTGAARRRTQAAAGQGPGGADVVHRLEQGGDPDFPEAKGPAQGKGAGAKKGPGRPCAAPEEGPRGPRRREPQARRPQDQTADRAEALAPAQRVSPAPALRADAGGAGAVPPPDILIEIADPEATRRLRRAERRRQAGLWFSFLLLVVAPAATAAWYLFEKAADQYVSTLAFAVRSAEAGPAAPMLDLLGGAPDAAAADARVLYEYLQSQPLVERIDAQLGLRPIYARADADWLFRLPEDASTEDLVTYWNLAQTVSFDSSAGIIYAEIRAFDPDDAQKVAAALVAESERLINALSEKSREDAVAFARRDLEEAEQRVRAVRLALQSFRGAAGTADVSLDIQSAMGMVTELRARRAETAAERDSRATLLGADSPVLAALDRKIAALDAQIAAEETRIASSDSSGAPRDGSLADAAGRQEELMVERGFAENMYTAALAAVEAARAEARRSQRYLAIHIAPTRAQEAEHPRRWTLSIAIAALCLVIWSILLLIASSIRDRN